MDTQHTAIHIRLWQRPFWLLSIAKFLLCMAVYMLIPILPYCLSQLFGRRSASWSI